MTRNAKVSRRTAHKGAALLTAMIIVSLIATLSTAMVWQQWQAVQLETAERAQSQAENILQGALDWSGLILKEDARDPDTSDHLGEPWAVPLAEARLSTFLAADRDHTDDAPDAFLSGAIQDAQSRYNLRNLVHNGAAEIAEVRTLQSLCRQAGLDDGVATRLIAALTLALSIEGPRSASAPAVDASQDPPVLPPDVRHLQWLGVDRQTLNRLSPWITLLPRETPVNLNTAPREVLTAVLGGSDLAGIERLIQGRQRRHLREISDATALLGSQVQLNGQRVSTRTRYFEVTGVMRQGELVVAQRSLLERQDARRIRVLRTERIPPTELVTTAAMH